MSIETRARGPPGRRLGGVTPPSSRGREETTMLFISRIPQYVIDICSVLVGA